MNKGFNQIFSTPIFTSIVNSKVVKYMEELIIPRLNSLEHYTEYSTDFFQKEKITNFKELLPFFTSIDNTIDEYSKFSNLKRSKKVQYWVQDYKKNQLFPSHAHGNKYISGVYYIKANENAGSLRFFNANPICRIENILDEKNESNIFVDIKPEKGLLVLFPSWLLHEVLPGNKEECIRTCLAFNLI
ncbi:MAG: putative 2OG-Fe(II) oxygenase [Fusobacterium sp.]